MHANCQQQKVYLWFPGIELVQKKVEWITKEYEEMFMIERPVVVTISWAHTYQDPLSCVL